MLSHILNTEEYALCLTPGFFRFYAHVGILHALEECDLLKPRYVTGSSAGALVGGFLAAGKKPSQMIEAIMPMERKDFWDIGGIGGLLKGQLFHETLEKHLPVRNIEECSIPFACTAYDTLRFRTKKITSGSIATAARASCTFPGLFQPVIIDGTPHIDGGVWDWTGLMALDECILADARRKQEQSSPASSAGSAAKLELETIFPRNSLVVNICYDTDFGSKLPASLSHARLLTIVVENIPPVTPFTMGKMGIEAYKLGKAAMHRALFSCHMQELSSNHWCCYVDGNLVHHIPPEIRNSLPAPQVSVDEPFTPRSLPTIGSNARLSNQTSPRHQPVLSLPSSSSAATRPPGAVSRNTSSVTNTSDHHLAEAALFHVHDEIADDQTLDGRDDDNSHHNHYSINNNNDTTIITTVPSSSSSSSSLLPSMPGVNLLPSFHLPHLPEHLGDFVHLPSYPFVHGTYFYEAFHHTAQNAADTLHQTLHAMNTTMSSTLESLLSMNHEANTGRGTKRRRGEEDGDGNENDFRPATDHTPQGDLNTNHVPTNTQQSQSYPPSKLARVAQSPQVFQPVAFLATSNHTSPPCEELLDFPPLSKTTTINTTTTATNTITDASSSQGHMAIDAMPDYHRDSEDLDDALAILDAVDFMVSTHQHHHTTHTHDHLPHTATSTQQSHMLLPQTQYSPLTIPQAMNMSMTATQQSPPNSVMDDAMEVFASVIDGEVAAAAAQQPQPFGPLSS